MRLLQHIILVIILFFLNSICFAQWENIDSLRKILPSLKDTARIDCLSNIGIYYLMNMQKDSSEKYINVVYEESKKGNYVHGMAEVCSQKSGFANHFYRDYPEMAKQAKEALQWLGKTADKRRIEIFYWQVGAALLWQFKEAEGDPYLDTSYYWAEKMGNKNGMYNVLGCKYEHYRDIGEYEKAFDAFKKSQELNERFNGKKDEWYENYALAELQRRLGNFKIALSYYKRVIANMNLQKENIWFRVSYPELFALNDQFDSAQYYYNQIDPAKCSTHELRFYSVSLGEFYLLQKKYNDAIGPLLTGLKLHKESRDNTQTNRALIDLAQAYTALQKDNEAISYSHEGLSLAIRNHSKQYVKDASQILYQIYQRQNKIDSALLYYKQYVTQKEMVENDVVKGKFAAYNYEQQIATLNDEKKQQVVKLEQSSIQRKWMVAGLFVLIILTIILFRNVSLKRKNEVNLRAMAEKELQLQKLESENIRSSLQQQATELEMQALRAQMNPHFIFNSLNAINRFILQNNKSQASGYLTKFSKLVRMILQNSQAALITLESEIESLNLYLELEALRFEQHFSYTILVAPDIETDIVKVPPLIIQPYVENAIWHGLMHKEEHGNLEVVIKQEKETLLFSIKDDGIGREKAATLSSKTATKHKSMGLKITAERIAMIQANRSKSPVVVNDLVNTDGTAAGTEVIIKLPVIYG